MFTTSVGLAQARPNYSILILVCVATADLSAVISADHPTLDQWDYGLLIPVLPLMILLLM